MLDYNENHPWITDELLEVLYEKDKLLKKAKRTNNEDDWETAKAARNEANIMMRYSKSNFINTPQSKAPYPLGRLISCRFSL